MEPEHHPQLAPSSFPALQSCAHYLPTGEESPQSERGTRMHLLTAEMLRCVLEERELEPFWCDVRKTMDPDTLEACDWLFRKTMVELPKIQGIEERLEIRDTMSANIVTFGRCDCYGAHRLGLPGLVDWKSGQGEEGAHRAQLTIYALGLMQKLGVDKVAVSALYCDQRRSESYTITRDEAEELLDMTIATQANPEAPYCAGIYCRGCKVREVCPEWVEPATAALVTLGAKEVQNHIEAGLSRLKTDPVLLGEFIHNWRKLEKLVAGADLTKAGIEYVEKHQGMDGWNVQLRKGRSHYTKDAIKEVLTSGLSLDDLAKVIKIDGEALAKVAPQMHLPRYELPPFKCLVWKGEDGE